MTILLTKICSGSSFTSLFDLELACNAFIVLSQAAQQVYIGMLLPLPFLICLTYALYVLGVDSPCLVRSPDCGQEFCKLSQGINGNQWRLYNQNAACLCSLHNMHKRKGLKQNWVLWEERKKRLLKKFWDKEKDTKLFLFLPLCLERANQSSRKIFYIPSLSSMQ